MKLCIMIFLRWEQAPALRVRKDLRTLYHTERIFSTHFKPLDKIIRKSRIAAPKNRDPADCFKLNQLFKNLTAASAADAPSATAVAI